MSPPFILIFHIRHFFHSYRFFPSVCWKKQSQLQNSLLQEIQPLIKPTVTAAIRMISRININIIQIPNPKTTQVMVRSCLKTTKGDLNTLYG